LTNAPVPIVSHATTELSQLALGLLSPQPTRSEFSK
jgi:hypothetical protein